MSLQVVSADGREYLWKFVRLPRKPWTVTDQAANGFFAVRGSQFKLMVTGDVLEGRYWIHLSVSHRDRLPSWVELVAIRDLILGDEMECIQIAPPRSKYVNFHNTCLHLWCCPDGIGLPDFRDPETGLI